MTRGSCVWAFGSTSKHGGHELSQRSRRHENASEPERLGSGAFSLYLLFVMKSDHDNANPFNSALLLGMLTLTGVVQRRMARDGARRRQCHRRRGHPIEG